MENPAERPLGLLGLPADIGDQSAVIAQVELRPLRLLRHLQDVQRLLRVAFRKPDPCPRDGAGQFPDGPGIGLLEILFGLVVLAGLELHETQKHAGHAVGRLHVYEPLCEHFRARPVALASFHQEALFQENLIVGIAEKRAAIEDGGLIGIVLAARETSRQIASRQRAHRLDIRRGPGNRLLRGGPRRKRRRGQ